jgi:Cutinase/PKD domain
VEDIMWHNGAVRAKLAVLAVVAAGAGGLIAAPSSAVAQPGRSAPAPVVARAAASAGRRAAAAKAPASKATVAAYTCPDDDYYLIGSRGSGQTSPASDTTNNGLGAEINEFQQDFSSAIESTGATFGFIANPYPAVAVSPSLPPDSWMWIFNIPNAVSAATGLPVGLYPGSVNTGVSWLVSTIQGLITNCPDVKILLAGYSQGAQVTGDAYQQLTSAQQAQIFGVFLLADPRFSADPSFGSVDRGSFDTGSHGSVREGALSSTTRPAFPASANGTVLSYCAADDPVCEGPLVGGNGVIDTLKNFAVHGYYSQANGGANTILTACGQDYLQDAANYFAGLAGRKQSSTGPSAVLTPVGNAEAGLPVTVSAAASCDPAGEALTYQWTVNGAAVTGTGALLGWTPPSAGSYDVAVTVTNTQGQTSTTSETVTVTGDDRAARRGL